MGKKVPEITPPNLRNRSWADFPRTEVRRARSRPASHSDRTLTSSPPLQKKTPGPGFGMNFGKEASGATRQPIRSCPEALEMRELHEHRPLGSVDRDALDARLMVTQRTMFRSRSAQAFQQLETWDVFLLAGIHPGSDDQDAAVRGDGGEGAWRCAGDPSHHRTVLVFSSRGSCVCQDAVG